MGSDVLILLVLFAAFGILAMWYLRRQKRRLERQYYATRSGRYPTSKRIETKKGHVYNYDYTDANGQKFYRHEYGGDAVSILFLWWVLTPTMQSAYASEHPTFEPDSSYQGGADVYDAIPAGAVVPVTEEPIITNGGSDDDSSSRGAGGGCTGGGTGDGGGSSCGSSCGGGGCGGGCGG